MKGITLLLFALFVTGFSASANVTSSRKVIDSIPADAKDVATMDGECSFVSSLRAPHQGPALSVIYAGRGNLPIWNRMID